MCSWIPLRLRTKKCKRRHKFHLYSIALNVVICNAYAYICSRLRSGLKVPSATQRIWLPSSRSHLSRVRFVNVSLLMHGTSLCARFLREAAQHESSESSEWTNKWTHWSLELTNQSDSIRYNLHVQKFPFPWALFSSLVATKWTRRIPQCTRSTRVHEYVRTSECAIADRQITDDSDQIRRE